MEWGEAFERETEFDERGWLGFAGYLTEYVGRPLTFTRTDDGFELRSQEDLLGRLTRPNEAYLAEAKAGAWLITHPRGSPVRVEARDQATRTLAAEYRYQMLGRGGTIRASAGRHYRLRSYRAEWILSSKNAGPLVSLRELSPGFRFRVTIHSETEDASELALLSLLSAYVALLGERPSGPAAGGASVS